MASRWPRQRVTAFLPVSIAMTISTFEPPSFFAAGFVALALFAGFAFFAGFAAFGFSALAFAFTLARSAASCFAAAVSGSEGADVFGCFCLVIGLAIRSRNEDCAAIV